MPERRVVIRPAADADLLEIAQYIAQERPEIADKFSQAAIASFRRLAQNGEVGSLYPLPNPRLRGLRKWPVKGFRKILIFYLVHDKTVEIVRIFHGARDIPRLLAED